MTFPISARLASIASTVPSTAIPFIWEVKVYDRRVGTQSTTFLVFKVEPGDRRFQVLVGVDELGLGPWAVWSFACSSTEGTMEVPLP